jgi:hypothetical protein
MLTDEQVQGSKIFESIQAALETPNSMVPTIRKAGREHHGSSADLQKRRPSGEYRISAIAKPIFVDDDTNRNDISEIAAFVVRECFGGVLLVTLGIPESDTDRLYFFGNDEDVNAVLLAQRALIMALADFVESPKCTNHPDIEMYYLDGMFKGLLRQLAFPSKPEPKYDSIFDSLVHKKEAKVCWDMMKSGITPSVLNLTPLLKDQLDELSEEEGYSVGRKL